MVDRLLYDGAPDFGPGLFPDNPVNPVQRYFGPPAGPNGEVINVVDTNDYMGMYNERATLFTLKLYDVARNRKVMQNVSKILPIIQTGARFFEIMVQMNSTHALEPSARHVIPSSAVIKQCHHLRQTQPFSASIVMETEFLQRKQGMQSFMLQFTQTVKNMAETIYRNMQVEFGNTIPDHLQQDWIDDHTPNQLSKMMANARHAFGLFNKEENGIFQASALLNSKNPLVEAPYTTWLLPSFTSLLLSKEHHIPQDEVTKWHDLNIMELHNDHRGHTNTRAWTRNVSVGEYYVMQPDYAISEMEQRFRSNDRDIRIVDMDNSDGDFVTLSMETVIKNSPYFEENTHNWSKSAKDARKELNRDGSARAAFAAMESNKSEAKNYPYHMLLRVDPHIPLPGADRQKFIRCIGDIHPHLVDTAYWVNAIKIFTTKMVAKAGLTKERVKDGLNLMAATNEVIGAPQQLGQPGQIGWAARPRVLNADGEVLERAVAEVPGIAIQLPAAAVPLIPPQDAKGSLLQLATELHTLFPDDCLNDALEGHDDPGVGAILNDAGPGRPARAPANTLSPLYQDIHRVILAVLTKLRHEADDPVVVPRMTKLIQKHVQHPDFLRDVLGKDEATLNSFRSVAPEGSNDQIIGNFMNRMMELEKIPPELADVLFMFEQQFPLMAPAQPGQVPYGATYQFENAPEPLAKRQMTMFDPGVGVDHFWGADDQDARRLDYPELYTTVHKLGPYLSALEKMLGDFLLRLKMSSKNLLKLYGLGVPTFFTPLVARPLCTYNMATPYFVAPGMQLGFTPVEMQDTQISVDTLGGYTTLLMSMYTTAILADRRRVAALKDGISFGYLGGEGMIFASAKDWAGRVRQDTARGSILVDMALPTISHTSPFPHHITNPISMFGEIKGLKSSGQNNMLYSKYNWYGAHLFAGVYDIDSALANCRAVSGDEMPAPSSNPRNLNDICFLGPSVGRKGDSGKFKNVRFGTAHWKAAPNNNMAVRTGMLSMKTYPASAFYA